MSKKKTLPDGRTAKQDKNGRWRSEAGTFIPNPRPPLRLENAKHSPSPRYNLGQTFRQFVLKAAQDKGHQITTPQEAFGAILAVQTEIALDPNNGSKATNAAKLIAQTTGILNDPDDQPEPERWVLGKEIAGELLQAIQQEKANRQSAEDSG